MATARLNTVVVARIWRRLQAIQDTQDQCLRPMVPLSFHVSLTTEWTHRNTEQRDRLLPEGVHGSLRNWQVHCVSGAMDSNLRNLWLRPLKAARPDQLFGSSRLEQAAVMLLHSRRQCSHKQTLTRAAVRDPSKLIGSPRENWVKPSAWSAVSALSGEETFAPPSPNRVDEPSPWLEHSARWEFPFVVPHKLRIQMVSIWPEIDGLYNNKPLK